MCGIFAYISKNNKDYDILNNQAKKSSHRGPDNTSGAKCKYMNHYINLIFHRLAINGLTPGGNQPMNINGISLICNGEIYNYKELASEYDIELITGSDCEIIIYLYERLGIQCIKLLDGVFSFVLYDSVNGLVYVGHDPIGIRSLFFIQDKDEFIISSEMKSLVYFQKKINMFNPGSYIEFNINNEQYEKFTYYHLNFHTKYVTDNDSIVTIQKLLYDAVKKRLITERPFGCLLSGGIDSSIITSIVNKIINTDAVRVNKVNTFSIGLENSPDLLYAEKVALHLGTIHKSFVVTEKEMLEAIEPTIKQIESYDTTTVRASVPMYLLSKYINETTDVKVIFSGEGADELSGSYLYFHKAPSPEAFQEECIRLIKDVQYFDVLRGDKTTAGNGLEIRVPFFDKEFVNNYMSIDPKLKVVRNGYEKYLLRKSFENDLPEEIIWRRKDGFSDGVSKNTRPWYEIINEYTRSQFGLTEKEYYMKIFQKYYQNHKYIVPYEWLPKWTKEANPSGRLILNED